MKSHEVSQVIDQAICKVSREQLPVEIMQSYELVAGLNYPISDEQNLYAQVMARVEKSDLKDADLSALFATVGLYLQGLPMENASSAVEGMHQQIENIRSVFITPHPDVVPVIRPDLPFGGESRRRAGAGSGQFGDTVCGRAADELAASGFARGTKGLLGIGWLAPAVRSCDANMPKYSGPCRDAAQQAFARAFLRNFVAAGGSPNPRAPILGPFASLDFTTAHALGVASAAANLAYWVCRLFNGVGNSLANSIAQPSNV